ncbi:MAG: cysteine--tRNA ligase, partial [Candidatus Omnitrophica bacterium]|nr:cysteine--tRNA ligase [Candidatus Omnitrophota bacterium]
HKQYDVAFLRNVTDVDDKIIEKAKQESGAGGGGQGAGDLNAACKHVAEKYLNSYHETLERLGISRPTKEPRATEHVVPEMTDFIAKLLVQGVAYEAKGDVYFAVRKCPGYGKLSNRSVDELQAGARVEPGEHKQDPLDFALWKAAKPGEPSWNSPWGKGRPGWHIECSAMSTKELGDTFDIHGGGVDLVFPHHENEIAQAQAAGKPFARTWIHNGLLTVNGEKMSKSLGNFITVDQALARHSHPDYLKLFFLKTHYRSPIDYSDAKMDEAKKSWEEFSRFFQHFDQVTFAVERWGNAPAAEREAQRREVDGVKTSFDSAMDDDLNTPKALAALFELVNLGHQALETQGSRFLMARWIHEVLTECGMVLGLFAHGMTQESSEVIQEVEAKIRERAAARAQRNYPRADAIRKELSAKGFLLTDTKHGTLWRRLQNRTSTLF